MKLHDLQVGQRFTFSDKHRGKVFEVISKDRFSVIYADVATGDDRMALSNRKTFRMPVQLVTENIVVELTPHDIEKLDWILYAAYTSVETQEARNMVNEMCCKLTGLPGRRVVLPDDVNPSPNGE